MAVSAIRKRSRIRNFWPSRDLRAPPAAYVLDRQAADIQPPRETTPLSGRGLTAHELIAMARAARARRLDS